MDTSSSQTMRAVLGLRGLIVDGVLRPGARVSEPLLVEKFNVSRTPARAALTQLAAEGLIEPRERTGYVVRGFTEVDIFHGITIRGTLEGLAARFAAERDVPTGVMAKMDDCVRALDEVVYDARTQIDQQEYARLNDLFHELLVEASGSEMVKWSLERLRGLPFAAPNAFVDSFALAEENVRRVVQVAQEQHRALAEMIRTSNPVRAQAIATEHCNCAARYLQLLRTTTDNVIPWVAPEPKRKAKKAKG